MGSSKPKAAPKASKPASKPVAKKVVTKVVSKAVSKTVPKASAVAPAKKAPVVSKVSKAASAAAKKPVPSPSKPRKSVQSSPVTPVAPTPSPARVSPPVVLASFEPTVDEGANPGYINNNEVLDEAEQAQMLQLQEQATISYRAREMNRPETHPDFDGLHCVECDDEIPPQRLALCRVRCVHCQEHLEAERKRIQRTMG